MAWIDCLIFLQGVVVHMALSVPDVLVLPGRWLQQTGYRFTVIPPASHDRVNVRDGNPAARNLRDVFG